MEGGGDDPKKRHHSVRRWTNRLITNPDARRFIWNHQFVIVPLNPGGAHWTATIITFPILSLKESFFAPDYEKEDTDDIKLMENPANQPDTSLLSFSPKLEQKGKDKILENIQETNQSDTDQNLEVTVIVTGEDKRSTPEIIPSPDMSTTPKSKFIQSNECCRESLTQARKEFDRHWEPIFREHKLPLRPAIFHFDSLNDEISSAPPNLKDILVDYFKEEFCARNSDFNQEKDFIDCSDWIYVSNCSVPKQNNAFDCGIFLIEYIRYFFNLIDQMIPILYEEGIVEEKKCAKDYWFNQAEVTHRRKVLRQMLIYMRDNVEWSQNPQMLKLLIDMFNSTSQSIS